MSDSRLRVAAAVLATAGVAVSAYLTYVHYAEVSPICSGISDCETVQSSRYAEIAGVPVAVLGVAGYLAILGSLWVPGDAGRTAGAFLAFAGVGLSAYLTYIEIAVIEAICQWCVISALIMLALATALVRRLLRSTEPGPV